MKINSREKLIVIVGTTASGKSDLAVRLAKKFGGEVISADSRQVYKGMDIGSGKITEKEMKGIPHHLLSIASPKTRFSAALYAKKADSAIRSIRCRSKIPILTGGTAFYIRAVVDGMRIPEVAPDWKLRKKLACLSLAELNRRLAKLDPASAARIEKKNPRRLVRALEIVLKTKKPIPGLVLVPLSYRILWIGIKKSPAKLKKLIKTRLLRRLRLGMVTEVARLHQIGLSWKKLEDFGLEYRYGAQYLQKKISSSEMIALILKDSEDFSRRQLTWFKKDKHINWVSNYVQAESLVKKYLAAN